MRNFTNRDYAGMVNELTAFLKETNPQAWSDFAESNLGQSLVSMLATVSDVVSFGQDAAVSETFLATCRRYESALLFAKSVGYVPRPFTAASATIKASNIPDPIQTYGGTIAAGSSLRGDNGLQYEVLADVIIPPGQTTIRVLVYEGKTYVEQFPVFNTRNQTITTANTKVAAGSWVLYVGDTGNPNNLWTEVPSVFTETTASHTYDVNFDQDGRAVFRFGDGSSGAIPSQTVTIQYRTCNGSTGNSPARSIKGSIKMAVASPGTGTSSVNFENYDAQASAIGGTQEQIGESVGYTGYYNGSSWVASSSFSGICAHAPMVAGQVQLTVGLPGSGGSMVLKDDGNGAFTVTSNTTIYTLDSSQVIYSSGAVTLGFNAAVPGQGSVTADYFFFNAADASQVTIIGAATGGDDRETLAELRVNIPTFIRTQDRLMTVDDYRKAILRISGVDLVFVDNWASSYNGNVIRLYVWAKENTTLTVTDRVNATAVTTPYTRYVGATDATVRAVQDFINPRTVVTVHHVIYQPEMLWVDLYLEQIVYDKRYAAASVRDNVAAAIAGVAMSSSGLALYLSDIIEAVGGVTGVQHFNLQRVVTGYRSNDTDPEAQGATTASVNVAGTLSLGNVSPTSVTITIEQGTYNIVLGDDGAGNLVVRSGGASLDTSSPTYNKINYITGAWSAKFSSALIANNNFYATYRDVQRDLRLKQVWEKATDPFPPSDLSSVAPYGDGKPIEEGATSEPRQYAPLEDILIDQTISTTHFYDSTYLFDGEISFDSIARNTNDVRCINVRRADFTLVPR